MRTDELDFQLPADLIAQAPIEKRAESRLLHYARSSKSISHMHFSDLPALVRPGDLLVFNNAKVTPARFTLIKPTGGIVEGLYLSSEPDGSWNVLLQNLGSVNPARALTFAGDSSVEATVTARNCEQYLLRVHPSEPALQLLARVGRMPLPPYIRRDKRQDARDESDRQRYQTVYAAVDGSVAAPTAGLHFTPELLKALDLRGVERAFLTLHVGLGTFKPVTSDTLEEHDMHSESYSMDEECCDALNRAKRQARRIIAIGTTTARVLESQPEGAPFEPRSDQTRIFIHPPYRWRHVNAIVTNFHLPRSTLIALVAAFVGLDEQRRIYSAAIEQRYRFFSYGDSSFLE